MSTRKDMTGQKFNRFSVKSFSHVDYKGLAHWSCLCECGTAAVVRGSDIRNGRQKSCGCMRSEKCRIVGKSTAKKPLESLYNRFLRTNKNRTDVELTFEDFVEIAKSTNCTYCFRLLNWNNQGYNLDRADNSKGYTKENVVPCCSKCNTGKSNLFTALQWQQLVWFMKDNSDIYGEW